MCVCEVGSKVILRKSVGYTTVNWVLYQFEVSQYRLVYGVCVHGQGR